MADKRVVGISAHGNTGDTDIGFAPIALVPGLGDFFMNELPRVITSTDARIDGVRVYECCLGFDRVNESLNPRRFFVMVSAEGSWKVEAYFGSNGSQKQAVEFLKVLEQIGIQKVTAFGPTNKDYWYEEIISPTDLTKMLAPEPEKPVETARLEPLTDDHAMLAAETGTTN
ncbi:MAG: hypothetical protein V1807_03065 [Patescibacteria group bacterium]